MGRFELLIGEARDGSPVYQQAHSREMPEKEHTLLYRWETKRYISYSLHQVQRRVAGWTGRGFCSESERGRQSLPPTNHWLVVPKLGERKLWRGPKLDLYSAFNLASLLPDGDLEWSSQRSSWWLCGGVQEHWTHKRWKTGNEHNIQNLSILIEGVQIGWHLRSLYVCGT